MDPAIASMMISAAGTGAPTNPSSRYYGAPWSSTLPDGRSLLLSRRIIPQADIYTALKSYSVSQGDRLDNLAYRFRRPHLYWMICDANSAVDPDRLTREAGRSIVIPLAAAIPPGARNG